jgi:hypothetical protein
VGAVSDIARSSANGIEKQVRDMRVNIGNTMDRLFRDFRNSWVDIENSGVTHAQHLFNGVRDNIGRLQDAVYDGMRYIVRTTNTALKSFDEKPIRLTVDAPRKAGGGMVGQAGERGRDKVLTYLGRGEAVLNWAQQKVVNSALWNQYGTTLPDMFRRNFAYHAGGPEGEGHARGGGDLFNGHPGNVNAGVRRIIKTMKDHFPLIVTATTDHSYLTTSGNVSDHVKGAAVDLSGAKEIMNKAASFVLSSGMARRLKQAIYSGSPSLTWNQGKNVGPGFFGAGTMADHANHLHLAIAGALRGAFGTAEIGKILVKGTNGGMKSLAQAVINTIRKAANKLLDKRTGDFDMHGGGLTSAGGKYDKGDLIKLWEAAGGPGGRIANIAAAIALAESGGDPNAGASHPYHGLWQVGPGGSFDPMENARQAVAKYRGAGNSFTPWTTYTGYDTPHHEKTYLRYLSRGGVPQFAAGGQVPGGEGSPQYILAHAGEWVLNRLQQTKLAQAAGISTSHLKRLLGFSPGQKTHFAEGGEVERLRGVRRGNYQAPIVDPTSLDGIEREIHLVMRAISNIGSKGKFGARLDKFFKNIRNLTDEDGLLDQMSQTIEDWGNRIERNAKLAQAGFRRVGEKLVRRRPLVNPVKVAENAIDGYNRIAVALSAERGAAQSGLAQTDRLLARIRRGGISGAERDRYTQLMAARAKFQDTIDEVDGKIADNTIARFQARQDRFNAQTDALLRRSDRRTKRFDVEGRLAGIFGNTDAVARAGESQVKSMREGQKILEQRAAAAARRAARDPRWRQIADELAGRVQDGAVALREQISQNFNNAVDASNKAFDRAQRGTEFWGRFADLVEKGGGARGHLDAARGRITLSEQRSANEDAQRSRLIALRDRATAEGNTGAVQDLTEQIDGLTLSMAEEQQTRKDLIATYRETATSLITNQAGQATGLIGSAQTILTTLGQISGVAADLVPLLTQTGNVLRSTAGRIAGNVREAVGAGEFGGGGGSVLNQLLTAFQTGPQQFATVLSSLAPQIAQITAGMSDAQATAFNALIASMVDNTTATVENTQQLDAANNANDLQSFASTAWAAFRTAIFTGSGGLLPQYNMPSFAGGGVMPWTGPAILHAGERVLTREQQAAGGDTYHVNITEPMEVLDEALVGRRLAFARKHSGVTE